MSIVYSLENKPYISFFGIKCPNKVRAPNNAQAIQNFSGLGPNKITKKESTDTYMYETKQVPEMHI